MRKTLKNRSFLVWHVDCSKARSEEILGGAPALQIEVRYRGENQASPQRNEEQLHRKCLE